MASERDSSGAVDASEEDLRRALEALDREPKRCVARDWPCSLTGIDAPGLYSWWVDAEGAEELSVGLDEPVHAGRIYAGQAGAQRGNAKANESTLQGRIQGNHLGSNVRASTFRRTLAAALVGPLNLQAAGPKRLERESEVGLTAWMCSHLEVAVCPFSDRERLSDLEDRVLECLDPPLNLQKRPRTPLRARLLEARGRLAKGEL